MVATAAAGRRTSRPCARWMRPRWSTPRTAAGFARLASIDGHVSDRRKWSRRSSKRRAGAACRCWRASTSGEIRSLTVPDSRRCPRAQRSTSARSANATRDLSDEYLRLYPSEQPAARACWRRRATPSTAGPRSALCATKPHSGAPDLSLSLGPRLPGDGRIAEAARLPRQRTAFMCGDLDRTPTRAGRRSPRNGAQSANSPTQCVDYWSKLRHAPARRNRPTRRRLARLRYGRSLHALPRRRARTPRRRS